MNKKNERIDLGESIESVGHNIIIEISLDYFITNIFLRP